MIYFCVIGAQKCGTTWLFENLNSYPELDYIKEKEAALFINDYYKK